MINSYKPKRGDIIRFIFGDNQDKGQFAFVLSHEAYNQTVGQMLCCLITPDVKGYPFEVSIPKSIPVSGIILADQVRSMELKSLEMEYIDSVPLRTIKKVIELISKLID